MARWGTVGLALFAISVVVRGLFVVVMVVLFSISWGVVL